MITEKKKSSLDEPQILQAWPKIKLAGRTILMLILLISVALRILVAINLGDSVPPAKDEASYSLLAARLVDGFGYSFPEAWYPFTEPDTPTAHWSFLYTAFIAAVYKAFGVHPIAVRLIMAILGGILLPLLVYRLVREVMPERPGLALLASMCAGVYMYFVLYAAMLMTETFYIAAVLWSLERAIKMVHTWEKGVHVTWSIIISFGLSIGLATLLRQAVLPWLLVLFLWLLWAGWCNHQTKNALLSLAFSGGILALMILPFTIRNYLVYGDFLLLNSNAGYAMYSAQHPLHGYNFQAFTGAPLPTDISPFPENEAQWDRILMARGFRFIFENPTRYLVLSLSRLADYFMFWPSVETSNINNIGRVLSFGLFLPFMIYGLWLSRTQRNRFTVLYLFIIFYTILHLLTWSMVRYRLPVDAILLVFAAIALSEISNKVHRHNFQESLQGN